MFRSSCQVDNCWSKAIYYQWEFVIFIRVSNIVFENFLNKELNKIKSHKNPIACGSWIYNEKPGVRSQSEEKAGLGREMGKMVNL